MTIPRATVRVSGCGWPLFMFKIGDRMKKFSDFVDPNDGPLQGEKVKIKDMLGK